MSQRFDAHLSFTELLISNELNFMTNAISFYLKENVPGSGSGNTTRRGVPVVMEPYDSLNPGEFRDYGPTFNLSMEAAQKVMDQLFQMGFRPSKMIDDSPVIKAQQAHLDDLRRLVFDVMIPPRMSIRAESINSPELPLNLRRD